MDLKVMPRSNKGHKYILCIIDEVRNYLIVVQIHQSRSEDKGDILIEDVITKYCVPDYIITYHVLTHELFIEGSGYQNKTVAPYNHQLLQAEHGIKSLSTSLIKHLTNIGQMWPKYLPLATCAHHKFNSPNVANCNPFELLFCRKPKLLLNLGTTPYIKVSETSKDY